MLASRKSYLATKEDFETFRESTSIQHNPASQTIKPREPSPLSSLNRIAMSMASILRTTLLVLCAWSHCFFYADGFVNHNTNTVAGTTTPKGAPFFTNCEATVLSIRHQSQTNKEVYFRRPSTTTHEQRRYNIALQAVPGGMQWFVKTEQFCKPYPQVKPYL